MLRTGAQTSSVNYCACLMSRCGDICPPKRPPSSGDVPAHGVRQRRARPPRAGLPRLPGRTPILPDVPGTPRARPPARISRTRTAPMAASTRAPGAARRTGLRERRGPRESQAAPPQVFHVKPHAAPPPDRVRPAVPGISPPSSPNDSTTAITPSARAVRAVMLHHKIRWCSDRHADVDRHHGLRHAPLPARSGASGSFGFSSSCSSSS